MRRKSDLSRNANTVAKKYRDDILSGKATAVKVPTKALKEIRKLKKYEISKGRVIVGHTPEEKAVFSKGELKVKHPAGIEKITVPVEYKNLRQYLNDIKKDHKKINKMRSKNEYFGFRFYGNNSTMYSRNIEQLIEEFEKYETVLGAHTREEREEIFENLEIVRFTNIPKWEERTRRKHAETKKHQAKRKREWRKKHRTVQIIREKIAHRKREADRRAKMKKKDKEVYKEDARIRAAKSWRARSKKGKKKK